MQRSGEQLPVVVVDRSFPQRLPDALDDAAVHLALDNHRIDLRAAVVDRDVALEIDRARLRIDFDHGEVRAKGKHEVRRVVEARRLEPRFHAGRHVPGDVGHQRDVLDRLDAAGRSLHEELAVVVVDVLGRRLQQVRGEALAPCP